MLVTVGEEIPGHSSFDKADFQNQVILNISAVTAIWPLVPGTRGTQRNVPEPWTSPLQSAAPLIDVLLDDSTMGVAHLGHTGLSPWSFILYLE